MRVGSGLTYQLAVKANELLGDGEWHGYEQTLRALMKVVPPGMAIRRAEQLRTEKPRRDRAPAPEERKVPRTTEQLVAIGARDIARTFLRSDTVFESDRKGKAGNQAPDWDRKVRQLHPHKAVRGDSYRVRRDQLEAEVALLRDQVKMLRDELINLGHQDLADKWAPEG